MAGSHVNENTLYVTRCNLIRKFARGRGLVYFPVNSQRIDCETSNEEGLSVTHTL